MAERVRFPSTTGPTLAGLVDLPEREVRGWGVFAHGFTLGKNSPAATRICKSLASGGRPGDPDPGIGAIAQSMSYRTLANRLRASAG